MVLAWRQIIMRLNHLKNNSSTHRFYIIKKRAPACMHASAKMQILTFKTNKNGKKRTASTANGAT